jgi:membrane-associated phospholipid phosphatase
MRRDQTLGGSVGLPSQGRVWLVSLFGLVLFAAVTVDLVLGGALRDWDRHVTAVARPAGGPEPVGWRILVDLGGAGFLIVALLAGAVIHLARRRSVRSLVVAAVWILAIEAVIWFAKVLVGRTPPRSGTDLLFAGGMSYPSGHAADGFALLLIAVTLATTSGTVLDRICCWSAPVVAALVAIATVQLHYHWPSDALAGWALGLATGTLARRAIRRPRAISHSGTARTRSGR